MSLSRTSSITRSNSTRSTTAPSNIRVFVKWHDQTVFAGEDVKCTITFKNVASAGGLSQQQQQQPPPRTPRQATNPDRLRQVGKQTTTATATATGLHPPTPRGHRSGFASPRGRPSQPLQAAVSSHSRDGRGHRKSVSIVSMGTTDDASNSQGSGRRGRFNRGHGRASSLQIMSLPHSSELRTQSATQSPRTSSSPLFSPTTTRYARATGASTVPSTPSVLNPRSSPRQPASGIPDFRFPAAQSPLTYNDASETPSDDAVSPGEPTAELPIRPKPPQQPVPTINEQHATPSARVLSTTSMGTGTPRSSGEFYSLSNNSSETLASEYVTQQPPRAAAGRRPHLRLLSNFSQQHLQQLQQQQARAPESLMMGYAQLQGSFTLDGSLVDLAPFESVKKKAVVGGQGGGGVVGVEAGAKRDSGLLGGFGWGAISNSLGELLGGGELSSIREMRGIASSRAVPLLSMPQSILFVDMQLAPGESKSFEYEFRLPRGLPPSHKGRAMKISYSLVIGTQRPGGGKEQKVRSVEVPFRVLGSVNSHGEILGHDLMSPYIILNDQARVRPVTPSGPPPMVNGTAELAKRQAGHATTTGGNSSTVDDFLDYVGELLSRQRNGHASGLLSPTAVPSSRRPSFAEEQAARTAKEAIDMAILRSNLAMGAGQGCPNRFQIARNGRRVAVVVLTRPAYRLGEVVTLAVDFSGSEVPCYAVHAALETAERVDAGLSVRSEASVHRVTRKVFVEGSEGCMFSRRSVFRAGIPVGATPEFVTSGVGLEWKVRLEFVVPASVASEEEGRGEDGDENEDEDGDGEAEGRNKGNPLLEEVSRDEKGGLVLVAVENLSCESFEVAVPLRVYGAVGKGLERLERDDVSENGLAV